MERGAKHIINSYLSKEITKIVTKLIITSILTFLAVKYKIFSNEIRGLENVLGIILAFCIIYFFYSVMQFAFKRSCFIITGLITGIIAVIVLLVLLSLLPEEMQGYVFIGAMILAIIHDVVQIVGHAKAYVK